MTSLPVYLKPIKVTLNYLAGVTAFTLFYLAAAKFGLWLVPGAQNSLTPVWPPAGIALAVILVFGFRFWPGILIGAFAITAFSAFSIKTALSIGVANTLEAMLAAYLLHRVGAFHRALDRLWDVLAFVAMAPVCAAIVGATIGVVNLWWGQVMEYSTAVPTWWTWWLGDAMGMLLVTPLLLTWSRQWRDDWTLAQVMEAASLLTLLIILSMLIFGGWVLPPLSYPPEYLLFPFVAWAALRLGPRGSALTVFAATAITIWDWGNGLGPAAAKGDYESLLELLSFLGVLSVTGMTLAAVTSEHRGAETALRRRTTELADLNLALNSEIVQRKRAERLARGQTEALAKSLAFLAAEPDLETFWGHALKAVVEELEGTGGALWFPDYDTRVLRLHLECVDGRILTASESLHPVAQKSIPFEESPMSLDHDEGSRAHFYGEGDPAVPSAMLKYLQTIGTKSLLSVSMVVGERAIAWMTVRGNQGGLADPDSTLGFAEALGRQATLAIQMARLSEQARESAVLAERNRLARDIHDTLAQGFTGVILQLQGAEDALISGDPAPVKTHISRASELARSALAEARRSVRAVRPKVLEAQALPAALDTMLRKMTRDARIEPTVSVVGQPRSLAEDCEDEIISIVQEALTNTIKHADASRFEVKLLFEPHTTQLQILDDGEGFDPTLPYDGFGLIGMKERASRIGGDLRITSAPGKGSEIRVALGSEQYDAL
ncbi:MAG: MASE1 domain-containing protein [Gammaproteobacteria bacterium]